MPLCCAAQQSRHKRNVECFDYCIRPPQAKLPVAFALVEHIGEIQGSWKEVSTLRFRGSSAFFIALNT